MTTHIKLWACEWGLLVWVAWRRLQLGTCELIHVLLMGKSMPHSITAVTVFTYVHAFFAAECNHSRPNLFVCGLFVYVHFKPNTLHDYCMQTLSTIFLKFQNIDSFHNSCSVQEYYIHLHRMRKGIRMRLWLGRCRLYDVVFLWGLLPTALPSSFSLLQSRNFIGGCTYLVGQISNQFRSGLLSSHIQECKGLSVCYDLGLCGANLKMKGQQALVMQCVLGFNRGVSQAP